MSNVEQGMVNDEVLYRSRNAGACAAWHSISLCSIVGKRHLEIHGFDIRYSSILRGARIRRRVSFIRAIQKSIKKDHLQKS